MYCPSCGSTHVQKLAVVYMSGFRDTKSTTVGFGRGLFVGRNRGTSQSRLSQMATPPRPRSYAGVFVPWVLVGMFGLWFYSLIFLGTHTEGGKGLQNSHHTKKASRPLIDVSPDGALALEIIGVGIGAGYLLILPFLLRGARRYNRDVYSPRIQKWNSSFMCQTCGMVHEMRDQTSAVAKTG
jgi:hypothetical protein